MTTFDPEKANPIDRFLGEHIDVQVVDIAAIERQLHQDGQYYRTLHSSADDTLPEPLNSIRLDAFKRQAEISRHELTATINFMPPTTKSGEWMNLLDAEIQTRYPIDLPDLFVRLPHEPTSIYARLSSDVYVKIAFTSDIDECTVSLSLQDTTELVEVTGSPIQLIDEPIEYSAMARFKDFSKVWLASLDSVVSMFGNGEKATKYQLNLALQKMEATNPESDASATNPEEIPEEEDQSDIPLPAVKEMHRIRGMAKAKDQLTSSVDILRDAEEMNRLGIRVPHLILHGPPGTGKTSLVNAFASDAVANKYYITSADIIDKYVGESVKELVNEFEEIKKLANMSSRPVIVIIEEIETIIRSNSRVSTEVLNAIKMFNQIIDEISKDYPNKIIIVGTTNEDPANLDSSVTRSGRLELLSVTMPNQDDRMAIWWQLIVERYLNYNEIDLTQNEEQKLIDQKELFIPFSNFVDPSRLAVLTEDMVGADFVEALNQAMRQAVTESRRTGASVMITQEMLEKAIQDQKRR